MTESKDSHARESKTLHVFGPVKRTRRLRSQKPTILIASDSSFFNELLSRQLSELNFLTSTLNKGSAVLEFLEEQIPDLLVVGGTLADIKTPVLIAKLRAEPQTLALPIILLSARDSVDDIAAGLEAGADDYISKPVDPRLLKARIENQLRIRALREDLERSNEHLRELGHVKDELLALCSHDLKVPLDTIRWTAESMRISSENQATSSALQDIAETSRRLLDYIDAALSLARLGSGPKVRDESLDLRELLQTALTLVRGPAERQGVRLTIPLPELALGLRGDEILLVRLFQNLLANAIVHSPIGGPVAIDVQAEPDWLIIEIQNAGRRIPASELEEIFKPFTQANPFNPASVGVGLAICKEIVERHYGRIDVRSEDSGTCFRVELPWLGPDRAESSLPGTASRPA